MIIMKTRTDKGITTFVFHQVVIPGTTAEQAKHAEFEAAHKAAKYVMRTSAAGFIAEVDSPDSTCGKILKPWDHYKTMLDGRKIRSLRYHIQGGAYRSSEWAVLGTEEECNKMAEETNAEAKCWADITCHVEHIVGPLWQCVYHDPYKD